MDGIDSIIEEIKNLNIQQAQIEERKRKLNNKLNILEKKKKKQNNKRVDSNRITIDKPGNYNNTSAGHPLRALNDISTQTLFTIAT